MTNTIKSKTAEEWGRAFLKLLSQCDDVQEVNELRKTHENTFASVKQTKPHITDYIEDQIAKRRSMLAQKP